MSDLGAELVDLSILVTGDDKLSQGSPHSTGDLALAAGYGLVGLVVLCTDTRGRETRFTTERSRFSAVHHNKMTQDVFG